MIDNALVVLKLKALLASGCISLSFNQAPSVVSNSDLVYRMAPKPSDQLRNESGQKLLEADHLENCERLGDAITKLLSETK